MKEEQLYEQIEDYLRGDLPPEARKAVEEEIATNPAAALELRRQQLELEAMQLMLAQELKAKVRQWQAEEDDDDDNETPPPTTPNNATTTNSSAWRKRLLMALAVASAVGVLGWQQGWWWSQQQPETQPTEEKETIPIAADKPDVVTPPQEAPQEEGKTKATKPSNPAPPLAKADLQALANPFYEGLPETTTRTGTKPNAPSSSLTAPRRAFDAGDFPLALALLDSIPPNSGYETGALELRGHALYQLKRYAAAAEAFAAVAASGLPPYAERAAWHQAVALVPLLPASRSQIDVLLAAIREDENHPFAAKASQLAKAISQ